MAKKKKEPARYKSCGHKLENAHNTVCEKHRKASAKEKFNLCTVCDKYFETKAELASHSHKEAA